MDEETREKIEQLRDLVYMEDIESPTIPEYREHHSSIQKILKFIDTELLVENTVTKYKVANIKQGENTAAFINRLWNQGYQFVCFIDPYRDWNSSAVFMAIEEVKS